MSFSDWVKSIFRKTSSTPTKNEVSVRLFNAVGPRVKVGQLIRVSDTGSMSIPQGTVFKVTECDFMLLQDGELIVRYDEARQINILHRVVGTERRAGNGQWYYVTKGDNNDSRDSNMVESEYIGRAVRWSSIV